MNKKNMIDGSDDTPSENKVAREKSIERDIELYSGTALTLESASEITRSNFSKLILLAGPTDSGKTTVLATINDLFQKGSYCGYLFCGSRTLEAFEQRSYSSRTTSRRIYPETDRTPFSAEIKFLHLSVKIQDLSKHPQNLLFTDISGENFRIISYSSAECKKMTLLSRADHFVLFFDCEKLIKNKERQTAKNNSISLLRRCIDTNMLNQFSIVDIVYAKYDYIEDLGDKKPAINFINNINQELKNKYHHKLRELNIFNIAARPELSSRLKIGYGLNSVFRKWVEDTSTEISFEPSKLDKSHFNRSILRYGLQYE